MKAIRVHKFGGPEVLKLEEVPEAWPGAGEVLVRIEAIGVNPVDTYIRSGSYADLQLPYTPGFDAAGTIEAVGPGGLPRAAGDRVYCGGSVSGTYAEAAICATEKLYPLPAALSFKEGAAISIPYATAYRALFQRARASAGEVVLIHGASGGVGIAAVQLARHGGLRVIGTAGSSRGRKLVEEQGAHHVLDHHEADYLSAIPRLTQGRGVDVIIEMLANVNLAKDLTVLAKGGRVVIVGSRGKVEITPRDAMSRDATILGMTLFNAGPEELAAIHGALRAGFEKRSLRPVIGREFPLNQAAEAHQAVMEPGAYGKILLLPKE